MAPSQVAEPKPVMRARKSAPSTGRPIIRGDPKPESPAEFLNEEKAKAKPIMRARKSAPSTGRPIIRGVSEPESPVKTPDKEEVEPQPILRMRARKTALPFPYSYFAALPGPESDDEKKAAPEPNKRATKSTPPVSLNAWGDHPDTEYPAEIVKEAPRDYCVRWLTPAEDDPSKLKWPEVDWVPKSQVSNKAVAVWRKRQKAAVRAARKEREDRMEEARQQAGARRSARLQQAKKRELASSALDKSNNRSAETDYRYEMEVDGEEDNGFRGATS